MKTRQGQQLLNYYDILKSSLYLEVHIYINTHILWSASLSSIKYGFRKWRV